MDNNTAADLLDGLKDAIDTSEHDFGELTLDDALDLAVASLRRGAGKDAPTSLYSLMEKQSRLMNLLGVGRPVLGVLDGNLVRDTLIQLAGEAHEAIDPLMVTTKPWKQGADQAQILAEVSDEVTDVLFFLLEVWLQLGWTAETVVAWYQQKYERNLKRLQEASV